MFYCGVLNFIGPIFHVLLPAKFLLDYDSCSTHFAEIKKKYIY